MQDVAVAVAGFTAPALTWGNGTASDVDLTGWIARGSGHIASLKDPNVFARAVPGLYGGSVTWDRDEGDLAIDSEHLRIIVDH